MSNEIVSHAMQPDNDLETNDLKELSKNAEKMKEALKDKTTEELLAIKEDLNRELETETQISTVPNENAVTQEELEKLESVGEAIDALIAEKEQSTHAAPETVSDILVPKKPEERTFMDGVSDFFKNSGFIGTLIKGWINLQKTIGGIFGGMDEAKIRQLDTLYGRFFGGQEVRESFREAFNRQGIQMTIVEGYGDGAAYAELKMLHQKKVNEKAAEYLGKPLEDASIPTEAREAALSSAATAVTLEQVITDQASLYAKAYPTEAKDPKTKTTVTGILQKKIPVTTAGAVE